MTVGFDRGWLDSLRDRVAEGDLAAIDTISIASEAAGDSPSQRAARLLAATARLAVGLVHKDPSRPEFVDTAVWAAKSWRANVGLETKELGPPDSHDLNWYLRRDAPTGEVSSTEVTVVKLYTLWWLDSARGIVQADGGLTARVALTAGGGAFPSWLTVGKLAFESSVAVQHPVGALFTFADLSFTKAMDASVPGHWWRLEQHGQVEGASAQGVAAAIGECLRRGWKPSSEVLVMAQFGDGGRLEKVAGERAKAEAAGKAGVTRLAVPKGSAFAAPGVGLPPTVSRSLVGSVLDAAAVLAGRSRREAPPHPVSRWSSRVRLLVGLSTLIGVVLAGLVALGDTRSAKPRVVDVRPAPGSLVSQSQTMTGRTVGLDDSDEAYLVVVPQSFARNFPQGGPVIRGNGPWSATVNFGDRPDTGGRFVVTLVVPDDRDRRRFADYLAGRVGGLTELSAGTRVILAAEYRLREPTPAFVEIRSPSPGEHVAPDFVASGVATNVPTGQRIWLVVNVGSGYYAQGELTAVPPLGEWSQPVRFGSDTDSGKVFVLLAVQADPASHARLVAWAEAGRATGQYTAMQEGVDYPDVTIVASTTVIQG